MVEREKITSSVIPVDRGFTNAYKISYDGNESQKSIFTKIIHRIGNNDNVHFVIGAGGTGKLFLLEEISQYHEVQGYHVVRLAPTGVAAYNIGGETIGKLLA